MSKEGIPSGFYPLSEPPPDSLFTHDTREAAELLDISPRQVMQLAHSGRLLFKFVPSVGKYQCPQSDLDSYQREQERKNNKGKTGDNYPEREG